MILKVETEIDSDLILKEIIEIKLHPYSIKIYSDNNSSDLKISIERPIIDYHKYIPTLSTVIADKIGNITLPQDEFIYEFQRILQHIESFGGLDLDIRKINWENPYIHWIAESDDEKVPINGYRRSIKYPKSNSEITKNWLQNTLLNRNMLSHLVVPFSFYREGINFYKKELYLSSFLNFFLMLEGLFANGKYHKNKMIEEFNKSEILKASIEKSMKTLQNNQQNEIQRLWLNDHYELEKYFDNESIIKLLVEERGKLSHYSLKSSVRQRNIMDERKYFSLAYITLMICKFSSIGVRLEPFKK